MKHVFLKAMPFAALLLGAQPSYAALYGGVEFPQGIISFADEVTLYDPTLGGATGPDAPYRGTDNALGAPDYLSSNSCASTASCTFLTLGAGGRVVLRFVDNVLTGSDSSAFDLWIFEIGPDVEDTTVDISVDGTTWLPVGLVTGATRGIDIDAFGYGASNSFSYVRLTDVLGEGDSGNGGTVGADIDAVGAISTRRAPPQGVVPEPTTWALMIGGFALAGGALRRRRNTAIAFG